MRLVCATSVFAISLAFAAPAQADDAGGEAIVVKGQLVLAQTSAWSTTTLGNDAIRREAVPDTDELLRAIPGMAIRDFGLGGVANAIVIRGFGNGGHGGDLGAVIDGIPLNEAMSHADGYVDLNVVVPLEIDDLTVFRGPVSALYGNCNRGGLLRISTRKGGDYVNLDGSMGSFGTGDMQAALGRSWEGGSLNLAGQFYLTDGYRPNSDQERQTMVGRVAIDVSPGIELAVSGRYHRANANSASYLTQAQFETDAYGIDPSAQDDGANKHFGTVRADLNAALSDTASLVTFAYGTRQDFTRWFSRPVSTLAWGQREESYERRIFGAGTSLNGSIETGWMQKPFTYAAGVEVFRESTDFLFFDGLDRRRRTQPAVNDRTTKLNSLSAFAEVQAPVHRLLDFSFGLRGDRFTGGCALNGAETGGDPCGDLNTTERLSPKVGARSQILPFLQLRANWAEGFALPNNFVKYAVGGQALGANVFRQTEVGATLTPLAGMMLDVAAFRLTSTGEVRSVAPGLYENFGATVRKGVEASAEWQATPRLWMRAVYSHTSTKITENADPALLGNQVAGVPRHVANVDARWTPVDDWTLGAAWRHVGSYQINATNTVQADPYDLLDLTLSYEGKLPFQYRAYLRIDNLTDAQYAASVSIIGGQTLVAPGAPRSVRAGVQISL